MRVLLVEDDARLRAGYALYLEREGWRVDQSDLGCWKTWLEQPYALAIVDAGVAGEDGQPLWLSLARHTQRPILALALSHAQEDAIRRSRLPNVTYLVKPFSLRSLNRALRALAVHREVA
jgi:DNA-binding response OmpR family regulator